ncbi:DUF4260 domain-containing protein [Limimaricola litoreus]|uniref:DUF4260 domain-containing protein n=1 Tax=Limimaricola litoreus TaxID=2955316 RepID=A0A9X2FTA1_9RHOB|nr:DUF4260 domain-containing protein [Limimaricola litoreus]MCP1168021.1 DUF4260 domain-containing protein [Limimaricola litoreus]
MRDFLVWQRIEGALVLAASLWIHATVDGGLSIWAAVLLFFAPDIGFAAYLFGPRWGALGYNLLHLYGFGAALLAVGLGLGMPLWAALGALWLGHAGFDRMLGYGLKSREGFTDTHLGRIGPRAKR